MLSTSSFSVSTHGDSGLKEDFLGLEKLTGDRADGILCPSGRLVASIGPWIFATATVE